MTPMVSALVTGLPVPLFDSSGRRIPPQGLRNAQRDANQRFYLVQPQINHGDRLKRLQDAFPRGTNFPSADEVANHCGRIRQELRANEQTRNILNGVSLDLPFPLLEFSDLGVLLDRTILPAAGRAYKAQFPERGFNNYHSGELEGAVKILTGYRHESFIARLAGWSKGPRAAVYFPNPLQGFSVEAQREQMVSLQEHFLLSGFDVPIAMATYPDVLARDVNTPGLDMAALEWQGPSSSPYFEGL